MSTSTVLYILGFLLFLGGLVYGAMLLGVPAPWIAVGVLIIAGVALMSAVKKRRARSRVIQ